MAWRREVELRDREKDPPANVAALLSNAGKKASPFVPVRIIPENVPEKKESEAPPASAVEQQQIEIALPSGAVIRLRDGCDPSFVAKLLSCLKA